MQTIQHHISLKGAS